MLETKAKRLLILPLVLALLVCSLAVPVSAAEDHLSIYNFSVTGLSSTVVSGTYETLKLRSVLYNAFFTNSAVITSCNSSYVYGYFWDELGRLCSGAWENPKSVINASVLGVYPLSSLSLADYFLYAGNSVERYLYFSKNLAEQSPDYLTSSLYALCWEDIDVDTVWYAYFKSATNTTWSTGVFNISLVVTPTAITNMTKYYAAGSDSVLWNVVPEGGTTSGSGGSSDGDSSTSPYIYVSIPTTVTKGLYIIPRAELMNPGDISGNILCFLSGHNSAYTKLTESDSLDNMWTLDCGRDETASALTLTFMVEGRPDIYTTYIVTVLDSETDNEGSSGELSPTEPETEPTISDLDKERDEAQNAGDELTGELEEVIPDYSEDIGQALASLASALAYDGTEAVLRIPQVNFPQVGDLIPAFVMMEAQEVDMGEYVNMMPPELLLLVQSLLTGALIMYCFYELYSSVGMVLMPKGGAD